MALKIRTVMTYPLNGSTVDFGITFEYLARKFVSVTLIGKDRKELVLNQDFRFTTKTQITTTRAWSPSDGYTMIEIRRYTSATDRLVDFADGSILRAYDLNIAQVQTLHVAEEARDLTADTIGVNNDGDLDARGRRIVNVGDAVSPDDAVNLGQLQKWDTSALNSAKNARDSEDRAWNHKEAARVHDENSRASATSANNANAMAKRWATDPNVVEVSAGGESLRSSKTYAEWAKNDAVSAYNYKEETRGFRDQAENSKNAAKVSETNAKSSEERAILEASKLGNMNNLAASIESAPGTGDFHVKWKGIHVFKGGWQVVNRDGTGDLFHSGIWRGNDGSTYNDFVLERGGVGRSYFTLAWGADGKSFVTFDQSILPKADIKSLWTGSAAHADQWVTDAPLWNQIPEHASNQYFPIIKQKSYQPGRDARAWHQGTLIESTGKAVWNLMNTGEGGASTVWSFMPDGKLVTPGGITIGNGANLIMDNATIMADGNISGGAYGNILLTDFLRKNWLADVYWGPARFVARTQSQYQEFLAGWGESMDGMVMGKANSVDGVRFRALWVSYHDGTKRIVASQ